MSPTRRLAVTDVGRFASGEVSGNVDREWRLATHSSRCRDRRARRGPVDSARRSVRKRPLIEPRSLQIVASLARISSRSGRR